MDERELATEEEIEAAIQLNRWFWLLFLKAGPRRDQDEATLDRLQLAHLQHLTWLMHQGLLTLFGPVEDAGDLRGIGVVLTDTREAAEALLADDPMVKAGRLIAEIRPWFTKPGASLPG